MYNTNNTIRREEGGNKSDSGPGNRLEIDSKFRSRITKIQIQSAYIPFYLHTPYIPIPLTKKYNTFYPHPIVSERNTQRSIKDACLRWRQRLKRLRNLLLPPQPRLPEDLRRRLEVLHPLCQKSRAQDDGVVAHDVLMVVHVGGAVFAEEAVDGFAWACR